MFLKSKGARVVAKDAGSTRGTSPSKPTSSAYRIASQSATRKQAADIAKIEKESKAGPVI